MRRKQWPSPPARTVGLWGEEGGEGESRGKTTSRIRRSGFFLKCVRKRIPEKLRLSWQPEAYARWYPSNHARTHSHNRPPFSCKNSQTFLRWTGLTCFAGQEGNLTKAKHRRLSFRKISIPDKSSKLDERRQSAQRMSIHNGFKTHNE